jgi:hypothetical protein
MYRNVQMVNGLLIYPSQLEGILICSQTRTQGPVQSSTSMSAIERVQRAPAELKLDAQKL